MNLFLLPFLISLVTLRVSIRYFRKFKLDKPDFRSSHVFPTPTAGGIVFIISSYLFFIINGIFYPLYLIPILLISFVDDYKNVSSLLRFGTQFIIGSFVVYNSHLFNVVYIKNSTILNIACFCFLLLLFLTIINFVNFMDGLDGLVAGSFFVIYALISYKISIYFLPVSASLLAFLIFNWSPAKIFMGDVGSTFLGGLFISTLYNSHDIQKPIEFMVIFFPLFLDPFVTLVRRLFAGQSIFKPHKLHLYQRLHQAGYSHAIISSIYICSILTLGYSILLIGGKSIFIVPSMILAMFIYLEKFYATQFKIASERIGYSKLIK